MNNYEKFKHKDPNFLVVFHPKENVENCIDGFYIHWHEHIEILCFVEGNATVSINNNHIEAKERDIIVINSNALHDITQKSSNCKYHCLILDKQFCDDYFFSIENLWFKEKIYDKRIEKIIFSIAFEMSGKQSYYKARVKAYSIELLVLLAREFSTKISEVMTKGSQQKREFIKSAINYISSRYCQTITIDEVAYHVGMSKYYFCRVFKETVGQTVLDYINILRCNHARRLLNTGKYNVGESCRASGFNNLSYFTKTYKKHIGVSPSKDIIV